MKSEEWIVEFGTCQLKGHQIPQKFFQKLSDSGKVELEKMGNL
jgi:hypothetical protein